MELRSNHKPIMSQQQQWPPTYHAFRAAKNRPTNVEPPAAPWDSRPVIASTNTASCVLVQQHTTFPQRLVGTFRIPELSSERVDSGYSHRWYIIHSNSCPTAEDPYEQHTSQQPILHRLAGVGGRETRWSWSNVCSSAGTTIQGVQ